LPILGPDAPHRCRAIRPVWRSSAGPALAGVFDRPLLRSPFRKEVIQPQLPLQLPCYDFVPVTSPTFGGSLLAVGSPTSGVASSHDVTGGVYKARERIHRSIAVLRLLATPASRRRVAACDPN
jgi:hypothetical protein